MKFSISLTDLERLLKNSGVSKAKTADSFILSACAARVFVEFKGDVAGLEGVVLADGAVTLPAKKFAALLKTYKGTKLLTCNGGPNGLKVQNFTMPVLAWNPHPAPPADFQVFPVTNPGIVAPSPEPRR